jgi:hypothetical protein
MQAIDELFNANQVRLLLVLGLGSGLGLGWEKSGVCVRVVLGL